MSSYSSSQTTQFFLSVAGMDDYSVIGQHSGIVSLRRQAKLWGLAWRTRGGLLVIDVIFDKQYFHGANTY